MAQSIDDFMAELRADVDKFETDYRKKAEENPEHYPLEMKDGNEGMWFECFLTYAQTGQV